MPIHPDSYEPYDGPRGTERPWWTVARQTLGSMLSWTRTKLTLLAVWIFPALALIGVIVEYSLRTSGTELPAPEGQFVGAFATYQTYAVALVYLASGCGIVSHDIRYRTLPFVLSKPITRWDYLGGKLLALSLLGALTAVVPTLLVGALRLGMLASIDLAGPIVGATLSALGVALAATVITAALVGAISSLTGRTGLVVLGVIGALVAPWILSTILQLATDTRAAGNLLSLHGAFSLVIDQWIYGDGGGVPAWSPFAALGVLFGGSIAVMHWRLQHAGDIH
jgi:ABC-type transport system involved in multi-copper enzyme maturation permease subunit